jgi:hypothetical protein
MQNSVSKLDELQGRLSCLLDVLTGGEDELSGPPSARSPEMRRKKSSTSCKPATQPQRRPLFKPLTPIQQRCQAAPSDTVSEVLGGWKDAERCWIEEKGRLQLSLKRERQKAAKLQAECSRALDQVRFRVGEVDHLKNALKGRDNHITDLQDRLRELEACEGTKKIEGDGAAKPKLMHTPSLCNSEVRWVGCAC